jgi:hypothetical protein
MNTSAISKVHHYHDKMLNSASAVARGMEGYLHFPWLNQTEPATFSILSFCAFFMAYFASIL